MRLAEGVDMRKTHRLTRRKYTNPGPNYLWHFDGNDKLKLFGLGIHRCIDGYSRRILCLEVSRSNKDPTIVGKYFLDCIDQLNGAPRAIRADRRVQNTAIAGTQRYFHNFENSSFLFGKSSSNQRIETWLSVSHRRFLQIWMNLFKDMRDEGLYDDSNVFHVECLVFYFYGIIQDELTKTMTEWNTNRIRCIRNSETSAGKPDALFLHQTLLIDI